MRVDPIQHHHHHRSPPSIKRKNSDTLKHLKNLPVREFQKLSPLPKLNSGAKLNKHCSSTTIESTKNPRSKQCLKKIARTFDGQQFYPDSDYEDDEVETKTIGQPLKDYNGLNGTDDKRNFGRNSIDDTNGQNSLKETEIWHLNDTRTNNKVESQSPNEILSPATLSCRSASKNGQSTSSKCACTSCKQQTTSKTNDNQNKTKSVGTQHDANSAYDPWIRQTSHSNGGNKLKGNNVSTSKAIKSANSNTKVIVITDDFKAKALNQEVVIDTKRNILRYMKANKLAKKNSSRSMDDVRISTDESDNNQIGDRNESKSIRIKDSSNKSINRDDLNTIDKQKAISKSVDNVSQLSGELAPLDNVGSVELIIISDEYLNKAADQNVIILKNNSKSMNNSNARKLKQQLNARNNANNESSNSAGAGHSSSEKGSTSANASKITTVTTGRRKLVQNELNLSLNEPNGHANDDNNVNDENINAENQQNGNENGNSNSYPEDEDTGAINGHSKQIKTKKSKINRQSSAETSIDDVSNKITTCAFQSYDEDPEHLESKEIQSQSSI